MLRVTGATSGTGAPDQSPGIYLHFYAYGQGAPWPYAKNFLLSGKVTPTMKTLVFDMRVVDRSIPAAVGNHTLEIGTYFRDLTDPDVYQQGAHGYNFVNVAWTKGVWRTLRIDLSKPDFTIADGMGGKIPWARAETLTRFYIDSQQGNWLQAVVEVRNFRFE